MIGLGALLSSCTISASAAPVIDPGIPLPATYAQASVPGAGGDLAEWWHGFDDPLLTELVVRAADGNPDVAVARAQLQQARQSLVQARAGWLPTLGATAGENHAVNSAQGMTAATDALSLGIDAAWQADLFGGTSSAVRASRAGAQSAAFRLEAVRTAIAGELATNYIALRLAQARLAIARDTVQSQDDNLAVARWRAQAGLVADIDVEQARAQRAQTAATIPQLQAGLAGAIHRIGVLTGQPPEALIARLEPDAPIPQGPDGVAVGIPADTLRQRPDVRGAERDLAAASAQIGVARAKLLPSLNLGGTIGTQGSTISTLTSLVNGTFFVSLAQTLFDGGQRRAGLRSARAGADAALATYRKTVLGGLEEVENGLAALAAARRRQSELAEALDASTRATTLARSRYRAGLTDFVTLLQSEQTLLSARDAEASARADQATALVQLFLALGGGWRATPLEFGSHS